MEIKNKAVFLRLVWVILTLLIIAALFLSPSTYWDTGELKIIALTVFCIIFWATNPISPMQTALLFFFFAMIFEVAPPEIIFSGFKSPAEWLVFGGLVIGIAIHVTGLGKRLATLFMTHVGNSYPILIMALVGLGILFGFVMPSATGRVVLIVPIVLEIANNFGFTKGERGRTGLVLAGIMGTYIPSFGILPANAPNIVLSGMSQLLFDIRFSYSEYFILHFPVLGLLKALVIVGLIIWLFPDKVRLEKRMPIASTLPFSKKEIRLTILLATLFVLWITDFIHHWSPAWIALGGAIVLILPSIGVINPKEFQSGMKLDPLLFVAGILGFGSMIGFSGLGQDLAKTLLAFMPLHPGADFQNYMSLNFIAMFTGTLTTLPGVPAVLTPLADSFATASGLPLKSIFMTQVSGFSTVLFPYQAPPVLVGMLLAGEKITPALKLLLLLALVSLLVLLPLNYFWWEFTGWL